MSSDAIGWSITVCAIAFIIFIIVLATAHYNVVDRVSCVQTVIEKMN